MWFYVITVPLSLIAALLTPIIEKNPLLQKYLPHSISIAFTSSAVVFLILFAIHYFFAKKYPYLKISIKICFSTSFFFLILFRLHGNLSPKLHSQEKLFQSLPLSFSNYNKPILFTQVKNVIGFKKNYFQVELQLLGFKNTPKTPLYTCENPVFIIMKSRYGLENEKKLLLATGALLKISPYFGLKTSDLKTSAYKNYLLQKKQWGAIYVYPNGISNFIPTSDLLALPIKTGWKNDLRRKIQQLQEKMRDKLEKKINTYVAYPASALTWGLVTGDKTTLPVAVKNAFRSTGTYQFLAVSGLHLGLISFIFFSFFRLIGLRKKLALLPTLFLAIPIYLFISNFQISMLRAYTMMLLGFILYLVDRKIHLLSIISLVFLLAIVANPSLLLNLSFQLSFSAVFGIAIAIEIAKIYNVKNKIFLFITISLAAQFFSAPFLIYAFGYFNFLSIFYNTLLYFLIPLSLLYSLLLILSPVTLLSQAIGKILTLLNHAIFYILSYIQYEIDWFYFDKVGNFLFAFLFVCINLCFVALLVYAKNLKMFGKYLLIFKK